MTRGQEEEEEMGEGEVLGPEQSCEATSVCTRVVAVSMNEDGGTSCEDGALSLRLEDLGSVKPLSRNPHECRCAG